MTPVAHYLLAAIETEYLKHRQWQAWADRLTLLLDSPEIWVLDLSIANTIGRARDALEDRRRDEQVARGEVIPISDLKLGFLYTRFKGGDLTLHDLFEQAGLLAEGGFTTTDCEEFYAQLNSIESGSEVESPDAIFAAYEHRALVAWREIQSYEGG